MSHLIPVLAPTGDVELLACLWGVSLGTAATVLDSVGGIPALLRAHPADLARLPGIGPRRAVRLMAALTLGRRVIDPGVDPRLPVLDARAAHAHLAPSMIGLADEELHALYLDRRHRPMECRRLTVGSDRFTVVDPRQIFRPAVSLGAAAVVLAHNHPSGDPTPSPQDREVTRRVVSAGRVLGVSLLDHLVLGHGTWVSMRETGDLDTAEPVLASWTA